MRNKKRALQWIGLVLIEGKQNIKHYMYMYVYTLQSLEITTDFL